MSVIFMEINFARLMGTEGEDVDMSEASKPEDEKSKEFSMMQMMRTLGELAARKETKGNENEAAAIALGCICLASRTAAILGERLNPALRSINGLLEDCCRSSLYSTTDVKRSEEFHLCVGEALACCGGGRKFTSEVLLTQLRNPPAYQVTKL